MLIIYIAFLGIKIIRINRIPPRFDQPIWVSPVQWVRTNVCIGINPTIQTNRIRLKIPPCTWIIIPKVVVVCNALLGSLRILYVSHNTAG